MKLYRYTCGIDEKYGAAEDEKDAYDRRAEVDQTFHFLPVTIEEVTVEGYEITLVPIAEVAEVENDKKPENPTPGVQTPLTLENPEGTEQPTGSVVTDEPENSTVQIQPVETASPTPEPVTPTIPDPTNVEELFKTDFDSMDADQLRGWLTLRGIKYHSQLGEKKLRELCIANADKEVIAE